MAVTPEEYGIDPFSGRTGDKLYGQKYITFHDIEQFMVQMRDSYAINICNVSLQQFPRVNQPFLIGCQQAFDQSGEIGLINYFNRFALYICKHLSNWNYITTVNDYNCRVVEYNKKRAEEINKINYCIELYNPIDDILKLLLDNWQSYWKQDGADTHECGRSFIRSYQKRLEQNGIELKNVFNYFVNNLTKGFTEVLKQNIY